MSTVEKYWCDYAWLPPGKVHRGVLITVDGDRITTVRPEAPKDDAKVLAGFTIPGMANTHSHAFHRALRGRTHGEKGTFWTWREQMYELAGRLEPDTYKELALETYREMVQAGITCVGEFHYLHHRLDRTPYDDPNAMAHALIDAAEEAGLRITLLDTCYLAGGIGRPLAEVQCRFGDRTAERWSERVERLFLSYEKNPQVVIGAAIHSVRAVPADELAIVAGWANRHEAPLHVHLSEQPQENADCIDAYGMTPTKLLHANGVLGPRTTVVHATHLTDEDIELLGTSGTTVSMCPTTERDLADGIGRARDLHNAGSPIVLGSDSHAVIDLFEEARAVELDERLRTQVRGHWAAGDLLRAATAEGHRALGHSDAGTIAPGAPADFISVRMNSPRTSGAGEDHLVETTIFAATAADVSAVVASGRLLL